MESNNPADQAQQQQVQQEQQQVQQDQQQAQQQAQQTQQQTEQQQANNGQPQNPYDQLKMRFVQILQHFWQSYCMEGQLQNCVQVFVPNGNCSFQGEESFQGHEAILNILKLARGRLQSLQFDMDPNHIYVDANMGVCFFRYGYKAQVKGSLNEYIGHGSIHLDHQTMLVKHMNCLEVNTVANGTKVDVWNPSTGVSFTGGGNGGRRWRKWGGQSDTSKWKDWTCNKCNTFNDKMNTKCSNCGSKFTVACLPDKQPEQAMPQAMV